MQRQCIWDATIVQSGAAMLMLAAMAAHKQKQIEATTKKEATCTIDEEATVDDVTATCTAL